MVEHTNWHGVSAFRNRDPDELEEHAAALQRQDERSRIDSTPLALAVRKIHTKAILPGKLEHTKWSVSVGHESRKFHRTGNTLFSALEIYSQQYQTAITMEVLVEGGSIHLEYVFNPDTAKIRPLHQEVPKESVYITSVENCLIELAKLL